ncbi:MAG: helix-turn-helix domain-containing protein [Prevotellaceae bacterium]|jgi:AraC-like DNA-binding protein|nr:helix-turn-helix domain-containing protein [Prevotellaceae bacterium]
MYSEHQPDLRLTPLVEVYWIASGYVDCRKSFGILPDGCVDIVFSFGDMSAENGLKKYYPNIAGTMTSVFDVIFEKQVQMFGIRFKPAAITAFTRVPVENFTNRRVDMTLVETLFDKQFYETLPEKKSAEQIIGYMNNYLLAKRSSIFQIDSQILYSIDLINKSNGMLAIATLASEVCIVQRHFERRFKKSTGISPKTFAKIVKLKNAIKQMKNNSQKNLFSIAIDCGYYDHNHMIKDFHALTGNSPAHFRY